MEQVVWARFDDQFVAYHRQSGQTHLLNQASHMLICNVLAEAADLQEIARAFASLADAPAPAHYLEQMRTMLDHLERLALIERV